MRKLIFFTIILFFSTSLFISCTTDEGDDINHLTARGKTMTNEWSNATEAILIRYADITFKLNLYIKTGQYNMTEDLYFQPVDNDTWEVFQYGGSSAIYVINTYGKPLDSLGSKWELTSFRRYYNDLGLCQDDYTVYSTVSCIDTNSWNIYSMNRDMPEYFFDINISCNNTPVTLNNCSYVFSGEGNLCLNGHDYYNYQEVYDYSKETRYDIYYPNLEGSVNLHFETETDLQKTPTYWSRGIVNLLATNLEEKTSSTRAEFLRRNSEYITIITYGGITEEWFSYYYYY